MMPELDGQQVLEAIRKTEEKYEIRDVCKIIMISGADLHSNIVKAYKHQCDAYIQKPVSKNELVNWLYILRLVDDETFIKKNITVNPNDKDVLIKQSHDISKLNEDLLIKNEELDQLICAVAHDLKAPLRSITNLSHWIEEDLKNIMNEETEKNMEILRTRIRFMGAMIEDMLDYYRIGRLKTNPVNIIFKKLIENIVVLLAPDAGFKVTTHTTLDSICVEKTPFEQVIRNLINNAIKHHHKKEGHIQVSLQGNNDYLSISVSDDGPGIESRYHDTIFEMLRTLKPIYKSEGTGMGLAMVKKIVETNGGKVSVQSQPGHGTTVHFTWPKNTELVKVD
jgi:signal transduction histidine kinase